MMMRCYSCIILLMVMAACRTTQPVAPSATAAGNFGHNGAAWAALWQQRAGEYRALCFQAYRLARLQLDAELREPSVLPRAIVTDIDETVLDNSAYTAMQSGFYNGYTKDTWFAWTSRADADSIPGARAFLQYAASRGVEVFYITNRMEQERKATLSNLERWTFPYADDAHLILQQQTSAKGPRRESVAKNYNIVMLLGDNLGDFADVFDRRQPDDRSAAVDSLQRAFGSRYIVLPNAMYGDWESALRNYNNGLTPQQKDSLYRASLKGYPAEKVPKKL
ncbi:5'-nucleotidase, lipoprotein e(P4) family [Chitinophaga horti]|uniref:5'-nucleotidase, lipoprotein e(P4) family n=1 Tax=Chitinophaga horti TaxID=2920382 RepID=A0ABY6J1G5_9BACT|nr:5'-nucleotidase, lipoprotein e(P4) family [Chitinophaga horti]UYQ93518.1 5'-nucleotidase, lipoprotein e(P4) family [Chitinophaga horti]